VSQAPQTPELPPLLRNNVACLQVPNKEAPGGSTEVYVLGMSHVSKKSVDQVKELIRLVEPEVVGVELCKDRLPLLINAESDTTPNIWHCRKIEIEGMPKDDPSWPTFEDMKGLLRCQPGHPISTKDIEADCKTLLSTGLFRSARPLCKNATPEEAPAFMVVPTPPQEQQATQLGSYVAAQQRQQQQQQQEQAADPVQLQLVPPLSVIRFAVQPRVLPPFTSLSVRMDSSLQGPDTEAQQAQLERICAEIQAQQDTPFPGEEPLPTLACLLKARPRLAAVFGGPVVIAYNGVETGKVEVIAKAPKPTDPAFVSGFESSAVDGEGLGIDTFRPAKNAIKLSNKMFLPEEALERLKEQGAAAFAATASEKAQQLEAASQAVLRKLEALRPRTSYLEWDRAEMDGFVPLVPEPNPAADTLGDLMTLLYAKYQAAAARKCGLTSSGAAWQAALQAGSEVGSQQLLLIDRPTVVTERKLADALLEKSSARIFGAVSLVLSSIVGGIATDILPESTEFGLVVGAFGLAIGLLWPLIGPVTEISKLADLSAEEIEAAVAVREPIASGDLSQPLKLFGEDAILDWPGALDVVIRERDAYMARTVAAAASGQSPLSPAYVRDNKNGSPVWRFMVPEGAPEAAAPRGLGDGAYTPLKGARRVVAVVGTAHVKGIVREWPQAVQEEEGLKQQEKQWSRTVTQLLQC